MQVNYLRLLLLALVTLCVSSSLAGSTTQTTKLTSADLKKLRRIEGTWRGTGDVEKPFYEKILDSHTQLASGGWQTTPSARLSNEALA
jgi:hypothetical protein